MGNVIHLNPARVSGKVIESTARIILRGGVIIYPTDTIYGIGCDAFNADTVKRIFELKGRTEDKPALVLVQNRDMVRGLVTEISPTAQRLMAQFWPGPLTILLPARENIHRLLKGGEGSIGVRMPDNRFCQKLLARCRVPIVSTSANISGQLPDRDTLRMRFLDNVDLFIDAGELPPSLPSTVVDTSGKNVRIIRRGAIPGEEILKVINGRL